MHTGKCIVFSAPSGSGKTTLVRHALSHPDLSLSFSVSATSRPPRGSEKRGEDYYFFSEKDFLKKAANGEFLEYEEVYKGAFYGTLKSEVERIWAEGKHVIFDIDVEGGLQIKKQFPNQTLAVFVQPPSLEVLEQRLRSRNTESEEKIRLRLAKSEKEIGKSSQFDVLLKNNDLETAKKETVALIASFLSQP
ncbi:MAG: guanylate kinase [Flavobacteriaceae bacterium]|nr:guanylate kinase [Flavobacteriaceae bacterium]MDG2314642.1 guanylate kinase [Flavobacteriaceae bacterium]